MKILLLLLLPYLASTQPSDAQTAISVVTLRGDTVQLESKAGAVYVLAGNYSCSSCYREVESALRMIDRTTPVRCIIRPSANTVMARRSHMTSMNKLITADTFYFDIGSVYGDKLGKYESGLFGMFGVTITPCVLIGTKEGTWQLLSHSQLYADSTASNRVESIRSIVLHALEKSQH